MATKKKAKTKVKKKAKKKIKYFDIIDASAYMQHENKQRALNYMYEQYFN